MSEDALYKERHLKISEDLFKDYGFPNKEKLHYFVKKIWVLKFEKSHISDEDGLKGIPSDHPSWQETKGDLKSISRNLSKAYDGLWSLINKENEPARLILLKHDTANNLSDLIIGLDNLKEIVKRAAQFEGKKGRRNNPGWHQKAVKLAKIFWKENKSEEANPYFKQDEKITTPGNNFTKWFCDLMSAIDNKITPSICKTAMKKN